MKKLTCKDGSNILHPVTYYNIGGGINGGGGSGCGGGGGSSSSASIIVQPLVLITVSKIALPVVFLIKVTLLASAVSFAHRCRFSFCRMQHIIKILLLHKTPPVRDVRTAHQTEDH
jgi:hypothetical protein